jgi:hypothetical protein
VKQENNRSFKFVSGLGFINRFFEKFERSPEKDSTTDSKSIYFSVDLGTLSSGLYKENKTGLSWARLGQNLARKTRLGKLLVVFPISQTLRFGYTWVYISCRIKAHSWLWIF